MPAYLRYSFKILSLFNNVKARPPSSRHLSQLIRCRDRKIEDRLFVQHLVLRTYASQMKLRGELKIPVPWGHVSAVTWGNPQDRRVLLVHGIMDNADSFKRLILQLPPHYYYVCIDLPGHGLSSHFPPGLNLDFHNFVLCIHYILNELNWEDCLYVGHSFGGVVGVMYAILFPGRLERIVALDALMNQTHKPSEVLARLKVVQESTIHALMRSDSRLYTREEALDGIQRKRPFPINKEAAEALFERAVTQVDGKYRFNRDVRLRVLVSLYLDKEHNFEFIKNLKTQVLLLIARESWFQFAEQTYLPEVLSLSFREFVTVVEIDGNHDVHNNNPEIVAPFVSKFFDFPKNKL